MKMTDRQIQLVTEAQNGNLKSFEELYVIYFGKIYALARMILKNEADAEDILQETFITAWRKLDTLKTAQTFSVWLQIIAKNLCNNHLKRKNMSILLDAEKDIESLDTAESDELFPAVYMERADLRERLGRIIDKLSEVQRQSIVLYYYNELTVEEISEVMECSTGTVKSRLFLARNAIRAEIEEQESKTGERFYGTAGIPMLPFGKLIHSHLEAMSISQSAAASSFTAISESISGGAGTAAPATGTQAANSANAAAPSSGIKAAGATTKVSLTAKAIAVAAAVAVIGSGITAAVLLSDNSNLPNGTSAMPGISSGTFASTQSGVDNQDNSRFTLDNANYFIGGNIRISVEDITQEMIDNGAWIGTFKAGAGNEDDYTWAFFENTGSYTVELGVPDEIGNFELRFFKNGTKEAASLIYKIPFTVGNAP